jgi:hypothetical protein
MQIRPADLASGRPETCKGLWTADLVYKVAINVEQRTPIAIVLDDVRVPDLVVQRPTRHKFSFTRTAPLLSADDMYGKMVLADVNVCKRRAGENALCGGTRFVVPSSRSSTLSRLCYFVVRESVCGAREM